jgi:hypothetical protein
VGRLPYKSANSAIPVGKNGHFFAQSGAIDARKVSYSAVMMLNRHFAGTRALLI